MSDVFDVCIIGSGAGGGSVPLTFTICTNALRVANIIKTRV